MKRLTELKEHVSALRSDDFVTFRTRVDSKRIEIGMHTWSVQNTWKIRQTTLSIEVVEKDLAHTRGIFNLRVNYEMCEKNYSYGFFVCICGGYID